MKMKMPLVSVGAAFVIGGMSIGLAAPPPLSDFTVDLDTVSGRVTAPRWLAADTAAGGPGRQRRRR